jgi:GDP-L-fucose synthase
MKSYSKIFITSHKGMVGSALCRALKKNGFFNISEKSATDIDLRNQAVTDEFFKRERPEFVIIPAEKTEGIYTKNSLKGEVFYDSLMIEANVIHAAWKYGVKKLLFLGNSCIYPQYVPQPKKEKYLLTGNLESKSEMYALAKICGIKLCEAYREQYGCNFISVIPGNVYGIGDYYHTDSAPVMPTLIRKFHEAKRSGLTTVELPGSGRLRREFLFVDDLAEACLFLMEHYNESEVINVGAGSDLSISELAGLIKDITGYEGLVEFNVSSPDGPTRKWLDISKLKQLGWSHHTPLKEGITIAYHDFLARHETQMLIRA